MVRVTLWGSLRALADGRDTVTVEANNTRQMLDTLAEKYPALEPVIESGVSVAVDGRIYRDAWFTPINDDSEVVLMPYMAGG